MGTNYTGSMGFGHHKGWLQVGVPNDTSLQWCESNQCSCKTTKSYKRRNKFFVRKNAIEIVPPSQIQESFYSTFFLVPKKTGGMRPVINLKLLNVYLQKQHFKIDTLTKVINMVEKGDWGISIDLKDAYHHIMIIKGHQKFLRFQFQGMAYQFCCLRSQSNECPENVCKGDGSNCCSFKEKRASFGKLHRRLVEFKSIEARSY